MDQRYESRVAGLGNNDIESLDRASQNSGRTVGIASVSPSRPGRLPPNVPRRRSFGPVGSRRASLRQDSLVQLTRGEFPTEGVLLKSDINAKGPVPLSEKGIHSVRDGTFPEAPSIRSRRSVSRWLQKFEANIASEAQVTFKLRLWQILLPDRNRPTPGQNW